MIHTIERFMFHTGKVIEFHIQQTVVRHHYDRPITPQDIFGHTALVYQCQECQWTTEPFRGDVRNQETIREIEHHCLTTHQKA